MVPSVLLELAQPVEAVHSGTGPLPEAALVGVPLGAPVHGNGTAVGRTLHHVAGRDIRHGRHGLLGRHGRHPDLRLGLGLGRHHGHIRVRRHRIHDSATLHSHS